MEFFYYCFFFLIHFFKFVFVKQLAVIFGYYYKLVFTPTAMGLESQISTF